VHSNELAATCYDCFRDTPCIPDAVTLAALADRLEEMDDARADYLRTTTKRPMEAHEGWGFWVSRGSQYEVNLQPPWISERIARLMGWDGRATHLSYSSRSAALLALAEALTTEAARA
jgi:hypothetical protein